MRPAWSRAHCPSELQAQGGTQARPYRRRERDGRADLKIQVDTRSMGVTTADTSLCLTGTLRDGSILTACDGVRVK